MKGWLVEIVERVIMNWFVELRTDRYEGTGWCCNLGLERLLETCDVEI